MSETPRADEARGQSDDAAGGGPATYPGTPGWVKRVGLVILVLVVLVVLATILGLHTPGGPAGHGL
jgi:hypothetical protein